MAKAKKKGGGGEGRRERVLRSEGRGECPCGRRSGRSIAGPGWAWKHLWRIRWATPASPS
eukprot:2403868-Rhodomonas_salina.1